MMIAIPVGKAEKMDTFENSNGTTIWNDATATADVFDLMAAIIW